MIDSIAFIGGGVMAEAMIGGLLEGKLGRAAPQASVTRLKQPNL